MQYESERIEYKSQLVDDIYKEVIAFANTDGGVIYIGVDDQGNVTGIATNKATDCVRMDHKLGVMVRPPKTTVNKANKAYLQVLDVLDLMDKAPVGLLLFAVRQSIISKKSIETEGTMRI